MAENRSTQAILVQQRPASKEYQDFVDIIAAKVKTGKNGMDACLFIQHVSLKFAHQI